MWFFIRFFTDFGSILDPTSHPKIHDFLSIFALGVDLEPSWRQEGPQSVPRQPQSSIFKDLGPSWRGFWSKLQRIPISILNQNFQVSARWRLVAQSALDIWWVMRVRIFIKNRLPQPIIGPFGTWWSEEEQYCQSHHKCRAQVRDRRPTSRAHECQVGAFLGPRSRSAWDTEN